VHSSHTRCALIAHACLQIKVEMAAEIAAIAREKNVIDALEDLHRQKEMVVRSLHEKMADIGVRKKALVSCVCGGGGGGGGW
jgi:hypothetical protein